MKRIALMSSTGLMALLCAVAPSAAAAHGHRHHRGHHHRARHANAHANAGTVTSFAAGVLTITLRDGATTVVGQVDADTRIRCVPAPAASSTAARVADHGGRGRRGDAGRDEPAGGDRHEPGEDHGAPSTSNTPPSGVASPSAGNDGQDGPSGNDHRHPRGVTRCDSSSLVAGTVLHEAHLKLGENGVVFEQIVLVKS